MNAREEDVRSRLTAGDAARSDAILQHLQEELDAKVDHLAEVAPERLVSLCVPLPADLVTPLPYADTRWFMPGGAGAFCADGVALRYAEDETAQFEADRRQWCCLGSRQLLPLALFTLPPVTLGTRPSIWIPEVSIRREGQDASLILSARRGSHPARQLVERWRAAVWRMLAKAPRGAAGGKILAREFRPPPAQWRERVQSARATIADGQLAKVVLARRLEARLSAPVDELALGDRLARLYPECHVFSLPYGAGRVVAATPECLVSRRGSELVSCALAGTAVRTGRAAEDAQALEALLASPKERREHALVVEAIHERMRELCSEVSHAPKPGVFALRFVQHLQTRLRGRLREDVGLLDAAVRLHPTPAVLGLPQVAAHDWLQTIGECRDGLYQCVEIRLSTRKITPIQQGHQIRRCAALIFSKIPFSARLAPSPGCRKTIRCGRSARWSMWPCANSMQTSPPCMPIRAGIRSRRRSCCAPSY